MKTNPSIKIITMPDGRRVCATISQKKAEQEKQGTPLNQKKYTKIDHYTSDYLYHIYAMARGKIYDINIYDENGIRFLPVHRTFYDLAKRHGWKKRLSDFQKMLHEKNAEENALTYNRMNQAASYVVSLFMMRMAGLANKFSNPNSETGKIPITTKDLKYIWEMMRTERGLPQTITKTNIHDAREDGIDDVIEKEAGKDFLDSLDKIDGDKISQIMSESSADDGIPDFIR